VPRLATAGPVARILDEIQRRPVRSLLIAAGTGYLAAGGLATTLTARLLGTSARIALRLAIVPVFVGAFERLLSAEEPITSDPSNSSNIHKEIQS